MAVGLRTKLRHWLEARDAAKATAEKDARAKAPSSPERERHAAQPGGEPPSDSGGSGPSAT